MDVYFWYFFYLMMLDAVETAAYSLLFAGKLRRRGRFPLRLAAYFAAAVVVSLLVSAVSHYVWADMHGYSATDGTTAVIGMVMYAVVFLGSVGALFFLFRESRPALFFVATVGECAMTVARALYQILVRAVSVVSMDFAVLEGTGWLSWVLFLVLHAACLAVTYLVFVRRYDSYKEYTGGNLGNYIYTVFVVVLFLLLMLDGGVSVYGAMDEAVQYMVFGLEALFCLTILMVCRFFFGWAEKVRERDMAEVRLESYERQIENTRKNIETVNMKCHDLKHQIEGMLAVSDVDRAAMEELRDAISVYDTDISTGYAELDTFLIEKSAYCDARGIRLSVMLDGGSLRFMSVGDVCSFFGNAVDNATEYLLGVPEEDRFIRMSSSRRGSLVTVRIENFYGGEDPVLDGDGFPVSTKEGEGRGLGLRSMESVARKYGGGFGFRTEGGMFVVTAGFFGVADP